MGTICPPETGLGGTGMVWSQTEKGKLRSEDGFFTTELSTCPESTAGSRALEAAGLSGRRTGRVAAAHRTEGPGRPPVGAQHGGRSGRGKAAQLVLLVLSSFLFSTWAGLRWR